MDEQFPKEVTYTRPEGGLFIWVTLPEYMNARELFKQCVAKKVAFVPGELFFASPGHANYFRLNYSYNDEAVIREGIGRIADVLKANLR